MEETDGHFVYKIRRSDGSNKLVIQVIKSLKTLNEKGRREEGQVPLESATKKEACTRYQHDDKT